MSLCYDFERCTIISLVTIAISLTVELVTQYTYGCFYINTGECVGGADNQTFSTQNNLPLPNIFNSGSGFNEQTKFQLMQCLFERIEFQHNNLTDFEIKAKQTMYGCLSDLYGGKLK
jgi:hypothetical protein